MICFTSGFSRCTFLAGEVRVTTITAEKVHITNRQYEALQNLNQYPAVSLKPCIGIASLRHSINIYVELKLDVVV